jgi:hypothetical protein
MLFSRSLRSQRTRLPDDQEILMFGNPLGPMGRSHRSRGRCLGRGRSMHACRFPTRFVLFVVPRSERPDPPRSPPHQHHAGEPRPTAVGRRSDQPASESAHSRVACSVKSPWRPARCAAQLLPWSSCSDRVIDPELALLVGDGRHNLLVRPRSASAAVRLTNSLAKVEQASPNVRCSDSLLPKGKLRTAVRVGPSALLTVGASHCILRTL